MNLLKNKKIVSEGFENLVVENHSLFISNHVSNEDIQILNNLLAKEVVFAITENDRKSNLDIFKNREHTTYDIVSMDGFEKINELLRHGTPVFLFPETKISSTGSIGKIYEEFAELIITHQPTIYPIVISGTDNENYFPHPFIKVSLGHSYQVDLSLKSNAKKQVIDKMIHSFRHLRFLNTQKNQMNLFNELLEVSKTDSDKNVILEDPNAKMTYKDLLLTIYALQLKLKPVLQKESVIGTFLPTSIGNVATMFALFKLGKTPALLNFSMSETNLLECIDTADINIVLTSKVFVKAGELEGIIDRIASKCEVIYLEDIKKSITTSDKLKALSDYTLSKKADEGSNELILFTSGSESKPKGVVLTHNNIYSNIHQALSVVDIKSNDRILNAMPMFHSFGLTAGSLLPVLSKTYVFLYPSPLHHKAIPELVYQKEASVIFGTSTFFSLYGNNADPYDLHTIRLAIVGAEKLKDEVNQLWLDKFGIRICEGYGVTETSPVLSLNTPLTHRRGTVGQLLPGMEMKIVPVEGIQSGGNLLVKGPNVMKGYLIYGKGFVPMGEWHDCGDIVSCDNNGYITIISRLKRFAKIGGEMISLNLVEDIATECIGERSVASVSLADKRRGEKIILFSTNKELTLKEIKKYIKTHKHSNMLVPKEIIHIESIPLLGSGKTDYVSLQHLAHTFDK